MAVVIDVALCQQCLEPLMADHRCTVIAPNIEALLTGRVSGSFSEWPVLKTELRELLRVVAERDAEIARLKQVLVGAALLNTHDSIQKMAKRDAEWDDKIRAFTDKLRAYRFCNKCGYMGPLVIHPACDYSAYQIAWIDQIFIDAKNAEVQELTERAHDAEQDRDKWRSEVQNAMRNVDLESQNSQLQARVQQLERVIANPNRREPI